MTISASRSHRHTPLILYPRTADQTCLQSQNHTWQGDVHQSRHLIDARNSGFEHASSRPSTWLVVAEVSPGSLVAIFHSLARQRGEIDEAMRVTLPFITVHLLKA